MKNFVYFDVEFANNKNKSICQIGLISRNSLTKENIYPDLSIFVNPNDKFDEYCTRVHGITLEKVKNEPTFDLLWNSVINKYFTKSIIIGHNVASSDIDALVKNLKRYELDIPEIYYIDTLEIAKDFIPNYLCNYTLSALCEFYNIKTDHFHDAYSDARACSDLLEALLTNFDIDIDNYIKRYENFKTNAFVEFISSPELKREIVMLLGKINAIKNDCVIDDIELEFLNSWFKKHQSFKEYSELKPLMIILEDILCDGQVTLDELEMLEKEAMEYVGKIKASNITIATQFLQGLIEGLILDNKITDTEVSFFSKWIYENDYLTGHYPYDRIHDMLHNILSDGVISDIERDELLTLLINILDPLKDIEINCIVYTNKHFCLSGTFLSGQKKDIECKIVSMGGIIDDNVKKKETNYLVVGGADCAAYSNGTYGTKVKKAMELNAQGATIIILKEEQLFQ